MTLTLYRTDGTPKAPVTALVGDAPAGAIVAFAGGAIPTDWLPCDGRALARASYPDLFTAIGTTWGVGDGSTTFNIPDLRGASPIGAGTGTYIGATARTLAGKGGAETHTLAVADLPSHNHGGTTGNCDRDLNHQHDAPGYRISGISGFSQDGTYGNSGYGIVNLYGGPGIGWMDRSIDHLHGIPAQGGGGAHNNMQPFAVVNWIIRVLPPYKTANVVQAQAGAATRVTSLPGTPVDGQECYFVADAANGVIWHLKYNAGSASAYKWELVGGGWLYSEVATNETTTNTGYVALATAGPALALPLAGDYVIEHGALGGTSASANTWMSYDIGATGAVDADAIQLATVSGVAMTCSRARRKNALAAGTLTAKYRVAGATGSFAQRWMQATPVRVG